MQREGVDGPGLAAALLSVVVWQAGLILQKGLAPETNAGSLMLVQVGCAAVLMWAVLFARGQLPPLRLHTGLNVAWGVMAPGLVFGLGIAGAARTDGVSIALIWGFLPLLGPILARVILGEHLHWTFPAGGLIGLGGLALMLSDRSATGGADWAGNGLVLASVICSSLSSVIARFMNRGRNTWFQSATLQLSGGMFTGIVIVLATGWKPPSLSGGASFVTLGYLILFMTLLNYVAFNFALSRLTVSWVGLTAATAPVVGVAMAWLLIGAEVSALDLVATAIIIAGVALPYLWRLVASKRI
jgi:drug/metabolite transporter (DMT)-like permease